MHTYTYVSEHADENHSGLLTVAVSGEGNGRKGTNISLCILLNHLNVVSSAYITYLNIFRHTQRLRFRFKVGLMGTQANSQYFP